MSKQTTYVVLANQSDLNDRNRFATRSPRLKQFRAQVATLFSKKHLDSYKVSSQYLSQHARIIISTEARKL